MGQLATGLLKFRFEMFGKKQELFTRPSELLEPFSLPVSIHESTRLS
jgi:hypothetical protein